MYLWFFIFVYAEDVCDFHTKKSSFAWGKAVVTSWIHFPSLFTPIYIILNIILSPVYTYIPKVISSLHVFQLNFIRT
jgi:hypothetical protein